MEDMHTLNPPFLVFLMVKIKIVDVKDLLNPKENPTLCLSPLRVFDKCHNCPKWVRAYKNNTHRKMKCKPRLSPEILSLLKHRQKLQEMIRKIDQILGEA